LKQVAALPFAARTGHLVAFAPGGKLLAVSSEDGPPRIYRLLEDGDSLRLAQVATHVLSLKEHEKLTFDTDRTLIISEEGTIWLSWPIDGTGAQPEQVGWRVANPCRVVASPNGRTLAIGGEWEVRFRDRVEPSWQEGECRLPAPLRCLAYAPDGQFLAAGTADGRVALIDTGSQEIRATLYADQQAVTSVAWSPDGRTLVSGSLSGKVRLWHAATQQELFTLEDREGRVVRSVAFSPDGRVLMTAGDAVPGGRNVTLWYGAAEGLP
jgi:WD40 repeat protein